MPKYSPEMIILRDDQYKKQRNFKYLRNDYKSKIWTSKYIVSNSSAQRIIADYCNNKKFLYIFSGSHGNPKGQNAITKKTLSERFFFYQDKKRYEKMSPRIKVIDISSLTKNEYQNLIRYTKRDALLLYCWSRNDSILKEALHCNSPGVLYIRSSLSPQFLNRSSSQLFLDNIHSDSSQTRKLNSPTL
ncbi:hypothetical protein [Piscirickettsia salmonis]|uniref:hypothetical protein n=1 Tax=Piscirickettsia salmonis TaxID=1238 RepID=UPI0007C95178|nr:hypothetical protein A0O36_02366 [Piscirickettsiaceae bacterium NZ-RLO1]